MAFVSDLAEMNTNACKISTMNKTLETRQAVKEFAQFAVDMENTQTIQNLLTHMHLLTVL